MGKGDRKTKRGKIFLGSYGVRRKRKKRTVISKNKNRYCCYCSELMIPKKRAKKEKVYPDKGETDDHIPQQCLFEGYGHEYKINRITVPSCRKCNDDFAKIESDLRDLIGVANDNNEKQQELTRKGVKSIFNKSNWKERLYTDEQGKVRGVEFDYSKLEINHIKNFKGIYYDEFKQIVPQNYRINVVDRPNTHDAVNYILAFLEKNGTWKKSGHEDIFRYKIVPFKNENGIVVKTNSLSESIGVFSILDYHKSILILVFGFKENKIIKRK